MSLAPRIVVVSTIGVGTGNTNQSASVTVNPNEVLLVKTLCADYDATQGLSAPTATGLTFTAVGSLIQSAAHGQAGAYQVTIGSGVSAGTSYTVSLNKAYTSGQSFDFGFVVEVWPAGTTFGTPTNVNGTGAPSRALTTTANNSAISATILDWNAIDGTTRTWRTINSVTPTLANTMEEKYFRDSSQFTCYVGYWNDAGTAGSKTTGVSAPSGQQYLIWAVEVIPSGAVTATGAIGTATASAPSGSATGSSNATGAIGTVTTSAPAGSGSTASVVAPRITVASTIDTGTGNTTQTANVAVNAGEVLLVKVFADEYDATQPLSSVTSSPAITFSAVGTMLQSASHGQVGGFSATAAATTTYAVTLNKGYSSGQSFTFGFVVEVYPAGTIFGTPTSVVGTGAPSRALTTTTNNPGISMVVTDWNAVDGASRAYRTINSITPSSGNGLEDQYDFISSGFTVYSAYWTDAGTAGSKTTGLSAPTGQQYAIWAVEVIPSGIASAIGAGVTDTTSAPSATATGNATGVGSIGTDTATAPAGSAAGSAAASGGIATATTSAPAGSGTSPTVATGAGATATDSAASGSAIGYAVVTLANPIYTGAGSICAPGNFTGTPVAGDTVRYPTTGGFQVLSDGTIQCNTNTGAFGCYYNDGTGEVAFTVTLDSTAYASGPGASATTVAPSASAIGGSTATGAGVTDNASAPAASAAGGGRGTGPVASDSASAPTGSAAGGGIGFGAIGTVTISAPAGSAAGSAGIATGSGATATTSAPSGTSTGQADVSAPIGTDIASAPSGTAVGSAVATGAGITVTVVSPLGSVRVVGPVQSSLQKQRMRVGLFLGL